MAVDIFDYINALFAKRPVTAYASPFILHRFLGWDADYCAAASEIQHNVTEPELVYGVWVQATPRGNSPRLKYVGPKKEPGMEALAERVKQVHHMSRREAEETVEIWALAGKLPDALVEYGVEQKK